MKRDFYLTRDGAVYPVRESMVCCQRDWKGDVRLNLVWAIMKYRLTLNLTMGCASNTD